MHTRKNANTKTSNARPIPVAPACSRKHPPLTKNRHINEHLTFCALHAKAARDPAASRADRANHKEAAALHMSQALRHYRTLK